MQNQAIIFIWKYIKNRQENNKTKIVKNYQKTKYN